MWTEPKAEDIKLIPHLMFLDDDDDDNDADDKDTDDTDDTAKDEPADSD